MGLRVFAFTFMVLGMTAPAYDIVAQGLYPDFHRLTNKNGLSQNRVTSIAQDSIGFIWIGTNDGLNRFDGHQVKTYGHAPMDGITLSSPKISQLLTLSNGDMLVGMMGGELDLINLQKGLSKTLPMPAHKEVSQAQNSITALYQDRSGTVFIGTDQTGLWTYEPDSDSLYRFGPVLSQNISSEAVLALEGDELGNLLISIRGAGLFVRGMGMRAFAPLPIFDGVPTTVIGFKCEGRRYIWLTTEEGLFRYDRKSGHTIKVSPDQNADTERQLKVLLIEGNSLWAGSLWHGGLWQYRLDTKKFSNFSEHGEMGTGPGKSGLNVMLKDRDGQIWCGTNGSGISYFRSNARFHQITDDQEWPFSIHSTSTRAILQDSEHPDLFWIGGYGGLDAYDLMEGNVAFYNGYKSPQLGWTTSNVYALANWEPGKLLVGSEGQGCFLVDKTLGRSTAVPYGDGQENLKNRFIQTFFKDSRGRMWVGTQGGLSFLQPGPLRLFSFGNAAGRNERKPNVSITSILELRDRQILIGTSQGLFIVDEDNQKLERLPLYVAGDTLYDFPVLDLLLTQDGRMSIATDGRGVLITGLTLLPDGQGVAIEAQSLTSENGLPNNVVYSLIEDSLGYLWGSTNQGIFRYDPVSREVRSFDKRNGLVGNEFNKGSSAYSNSGQIFFGGIYGISWFHPVEVLKAERDSPKVMLTGVKVDGHDIPSSQLFSPRPMVRLSPDQHLLNLSFSSFNYGSPDNNQYAYRLLGRDSGWHFLGNTNELSISSLGPGEYTLELKGADNLGKWSVTPTDLRIRVKASFVESTWFKVLLIGLALLSVVGIYFLRMASVRRRNRALTKVVLARTKELRAQKQELETSLSRIEEQNSQLNVQKSELGELSALKDKVLSIVSHDVRSPLNGIKGFLNLVRMGAVSPDEMKNFSEDLHFKVEQTLTMLDNLLKWAQGQLNELKPVPKLLDLKKLTDETLVLVRLNAEQKQISLINHITDGMFAYADGDMVRLILRNLVSNGVKFTPKGGSISISAEKVRRDVVKISVADDGRGMSEGQVRSLLADGDNDSMDGTENEKGTGLGLQMCKEFLQHNHGELSIDSILGNGSTFSFTLPMTKKKVSEEKIEK